MAGFKCSRCGGSFKTTVSTESHGWLCPKHAAQKTILREPVVLTKPTPRPWRSPHPGRRWSDQRRPG